MECMLSEKQKEIRIIEGFKFRFHKMLQGEVQRWTCCKNSCKCFFKLTSNNVMSDIYNEHNHDKCDEQVITRQKISNSVKRKAVDDISVRPSKILHNELPIYPSIISTKSYKIKLHGVNTELSDYDGQVYEFLNTATTNWVHAHCTNYKILQTI